MARPFHFNELAATSPYCNRQKEMNELYAYAGNHANVVMFSPRRYGKTAIINKVQAKLRKKNIITVYVDVFGVTSVENFAERLVSSVYKSYYDNIHLFKKGKKFLSLWRPIVASDLIFGTLYSAKALTDIRGPELLDNTFDALGRLIQSENAFHIVFDGFHEIAELRDSRKIESIMRSHIQTHKKASYFFVGSRRKLLMDIFNNAKKPFYKSAFNYELGPCSVDESRLFIKEQFKLGEKRCSDELAKMIAEKVEGYPYYLQKIPYCIFELSKQEVTIKDFRNGFIKAIEEEKALYELMLQPLASQQKKLLYSIAEKPTDSPYSAGYMAKYDLGSIGGIQGALDKLINLDYIEKQNGSFKIVDPIFGIWLRQLNS